MKHKPLGIKAAESILDKLEEIRRVATMETADFDDPQTDNINTAEIRRLTELWRQSWIISPLDRCIAKIKQSCNL